MYSFIFIYLCATFGSVSSGDNIGTWLFCFWGRFKEKTNLSGKTHSNVDIFCCAQETSQLQRHIFSPDASRHILAGIVCPACKNVGVTWIAQEGAALGAFYALSGRYLYRLLYDPHQHRNGKTCNYTGCLAWWGSTPGKPQLVLVNHAL